MLFLRVPGCLLRGVHSRLAHGRAPGKCSSAYACIQFIQRYIEEQGYGRDEILALLHQISSEGEQAA